MVIEGIRQRRRSVCRQCCAVGQWRAGAERTMPTDEAARLRHALYGRCTWYLQLLGVITVLYFTLLCVPQRRKPHCLDFHSDSPQLSERVWCFAHARNDLPRSCAAQVVCRFVIDIELQQVADQVPQCVVHLRVCCNHLRVVTQFDSPNLRHEFHTHLSYDTRVPHTLDCTEGSAVATRSSRSEI